VRASPSRSIAAPSAVGLSAAAVLLILAWLNPSGFAPWFSFYREAWALSAAVGFVACVLASHPDALRRPPGLVSAGLVLVAASFTLQPQELGASTQVVALVSLYVLVWASCLWAGACADDSSASAPLTESLAWTLLAGAIAAAGTAFAQWTGNASHSEWLADWPPFTRVGSNLGQANHFATLCLLGILAAGHLHRACRLGNISLAIVLIWLAFGLALAQSRTTWIAVLALIAWAVARRQAIGSALGFGPRMLLVVSAVYVVAFSLSVSWSVSLQTKLSAAAERLEGGTRPVLWAQSLAAIRESPWVGYGWLQGHSAQLVGSLEHPGREYTSYFHNLVLDLMVWNGVPLGLLISGLLIAWYVRTGLRVEGPADAFRFTVVTAFGVHSMLEYPFAYLYFIVPVGLLAGQLCRPGGPGDWRWRSTLRGSPTLARPEAPHPDGVTTTEPRGLAAWGWTAVFLALVVTWSVAGLAIARDYLLAENDRREVQMVLARIGGQRPFPPQPDLWVLDQLEASARNARREIRAGMPATELDDLATITRRYPTAFFLRTSAAAWALNGDPDRALLELRRLRSIHGEPAWQGSLLWLEQTAQERAWPLEEFIQRARTQTQR
jgi:O-antigen ligase